MIPLLVILTQLPFPRTMIMTGLSLRKPQLNTAKRLRSLSAWLRNQRSSSSVGINSRSFSGKSCGIGTKWSLLSECKLKYLYPISKSILNQESKLLHKVFSPSLIQHSRLRRKLSSTGSPISLMKRQPSSDRRLHGNCRHLIYLWALVLSSMMQSC